MVKRIKSFSAGYFTDETARALLHAFNGGYPRPAAMHIEAQSVRWALISQTMPAGQKPMLSRHAEFCARVLAGAPEKNQSWDTGYLDEFIDKGRPAFFATALHPNVRVISISSQEKQGFSYGYRDYRDLDSPVVLKAAGNDHVDWLEYQRTATLAGEVFMPGYLRVGEALPSGEIYSGSQASGPAFVCDHPRDVKQVMGDTLFFPTKEEVTKFLDWPHHGIPEDCAAFLSTYEMPRKQMDVFYGTSASAPHAGKMIMACSAGMDGITSYDIIPAVLMAAQMNAAQRDAKHLVETQSGMVFDPFHYGHGVLVEECLEQALSDVWQVRSISGKATVSGEYSKPGLAEGYGYMSARTDKAQGPVVNTVLALSFINDEADPAAAESRIPEYIMLQSPQGTLIHLPLLYDRKKQYGPYIRAGYQTSAFFGEDISKGEWRIGYSQGDENCLPIDSMRIVAHTMHPKSPALVLFRGFQKATQIHQAQQKTAPVVAPSDVFKP